ncbi:MAG: ABC transporter permease [Flavobacteriales bacterium]|nr:ABC transporter permease [Flavobacteriales bacterium]
MSEVRVYTSETGLGNPIRLFGDIFKGFREGRFLGYQLFIRDLKASVRQSFLGFLWHFIPAIATAVIWIMLNSQNVVTIENVPMKFPAFAITGTILWTLITESMNKPLMRFVAAKGMMVKLNFPKEALVLAIFYDLMFSFLLKMLVLLPALLVMGYYPTIEWIMAILMIVPMYIFGVAVGLLLVPLGMLFMDISKGMTYIFQIVMYLAPVVYPVQKIGAMGVIHKWNPVTPYIEFIRSNFGGYQFDMYFQLVLWSVFGIVFLFVGLVLIRISLPVILERSGS